MQGKLRSLPTKAELTSGKEKALLCSKLSNAEMLTFSPFMCMGDGKA